MTTKKAITANTLRDILSTALLGIQDGSVTVDQACAQAKVARAMLSTVKVQISVSRQEGVPVAPNAVRFASDD